MNSRAIIRSATRGGAWLVAIVLIVNVAVSLSSWKVLIRAVDRNFVTDYDVQFDVPQDAGASWGGRKVHRDKVCVYWSGARSTYPVFLEPGKKCPLFN